MSNAACGRAGSGNSGDHAAAAPLLRESVRGLTAVYGAEHPVTKRYAANMAENQLRWEGKGAGAEPAEGGG